MVASVLRFGAPVYADQQRVGVLAGVVLDPTALRWEALVVRGGRLRRRETVVPAALVTEATASGVQLRAPLATIPSAAASDGRVLRRTSVIAGERDGRCGSLALLYADAQRQVTEIGVRTGRLQPIRLVPVAAVLSVAADRITLAYDRATLKHCPPVLTDDELERACWQALTELGPIAAFERPHLTITAHAGAVWLDGWVSTDLHRQWFADVIAQVPGVLSLENRLVSDPQLVREVTQALSRDPRTRPVVPLVHAEHGVIFLAGNAADAAVAGALTEVAGRVPGVRAVVNRVAAPGYTPVEPWPEQPREGAVVRTPEGVIGKVARVETDPLSRLPVGLHVALTGEPRSLFVPAAAIAHVSRGVVTLHSRPALLAADRARQEGGEQRPPTLRHQALAA